MASAPMTGMIIIYAMITTFSRQPGQSAIEAAESRSTLIFGVYVVVLLIAAGLTVLVWTSGNTVQEAIRKDADARIVEATAATTRLQVELSAQQEKTEKAERALLDIQDRLVPRTLSPGPRSHLRVALVRPPKAFLRESGVSQQ